MGTEKCDICVVNERRYIRNTATGGSNGTSCRPAHISCEFTTPVSIALNLIEKANAIFLDSASHQRLDCPDLATVRRIKSFGRREQALHVGCWTKSGGLFLGGVGWQQSAVASKWCLVPVWRKVEQQVASRPLGGNPNGAGGYSRCLPVGSWRRGHRLRRRCSSLFPIRTSRCRTSAPIRRSATR